MNDDEYYEIKAQRRKARENSRPSYTEEEKQTVDEAKRVHKETTATAQRALKVCQYIRCI